MTFYSGCDPHIWTRSHINIPSWNKRSKRSTKNGWGSPPCLLLTLQIVSWLRFPILSAGFHTSCGQVSHVCWLHSTCSALNFPHLCDSNDTREQMALVVVLNFPHCCLSPFLLLQLPWVGKNTFSPRILHFCIQILWVSPPIQLKPTGVPLRTSLAVLPPPAARHCFMGEAVPRNWHRYGNPESPSEKWSTNAG